MRAGLHHASGVLPAQWLEYVRFYHRGRRPVQYCAGVLPEGLRREGVASLSSTATAASRVRRALTPGGPELDHQSHGTVAAHRPARYVRDRNLRHHRSRTVLRQYASGLLQ